MKDGARKQLVIAPGCADLSEGAAYLDEQGDSVDAAARREAQPATPDKPAAEPRFRSKKRYLSVALGAGDLSEGAEWRADDVVRGPESDA